jgi:hypothetical protein
MPRLLYSQWRLLHILNSYFTYWTQLLHILNTVASYSEQSYFIYWTELLQILNSYFTYWTQLLHILNTVDSYIEQSSFKYWTVTSHTEHSYFTYWTQLLHILNSYFAYCTQLLHILDSYFIYWTVTSHIAHCYFTHCTQLLHTLHTVTSHIAHSYFTQCTLYFIYWMPSLVMCIWQLPILNFGHYIRLCRGYIQSFQAVQYLQSDHNSSLHALPLTILPFPQFHPLTGSLTTNEHLHLPTPWRHETRLEAQLRSCLTSALDVGEGSVKHCGYSTAGGKACSTNRIGAAWAPEPVIPCFGEEIIRLTPSKIRNQDYQETTNKHLSEPIHICLPLTNSRTCFQQFMNF